MIDKNFLQNYLKTLTSKITPSEVILNNLIKVKNILLSAKKKIQGYLYSEMEEVQQ